MRLPTVWIRNKSNGKKAKVNAVDYASDLGMTKYVGWELVSEQRGDKPTETVPGKSIGIDAQISVEEMNNAEQNAGETAGYKRAVKRGKVQVKKDAVPTVKRPRGRPRKNPA